MIKVNNLSKVFRTEEIETTALNGVSFEIADGEFVAIMGPSGYLVHNVCYYSLIISEVVASTGSATGTVIFID
jgi:ABC-type microcin C transport system duplicated ATPase subunit YejF